MNLQYKFEEIMTCQCQNLALNISFLFMCHDNYTKQQQLSPLAAEAPWD